MNDPDLNLYLNTVVSYRDTADRLRTGRIRRHYPPDDRHPQSRYGLWRIPDGHFIIVPAASLDSILRQPALRHQPSTL